jgi:hypothetical protein
MSLCREGPFRNTMVREMGMPSLAESRERQLAQNYPSITKGADFKARDQYNQVRPRE